MGCCAIIAPDQVGALEVLGQFKRVLMPGLHCLPPCVSSVRKRTTRVTQNDVRVDTKTKDNVFVEVRISVQQELYKEKVVEAMYKLSNVDSQIDAYVADVVRGYVPSVDLDSLFENKVEIAKEVKERLTKNMQDYGYHILQVLVVDIAPDKAVKDAMNQINANRRLRQATEEKAEADKIILIKQAEAEKELMILKAQADGESKFLQGQGIARSRKAIVDGLKESIFGGSGTESGLDPKAVEQLLLVTQYLDTLEKMSAGQATTIFMPHGPKAVLDFQEQLLAAMGSTTTVPSSA